MKRIELSNLPTLDYPCTEAMNTLSTNLSFAGRGVKTILITSCRAGDGKSFLSMNLMRALASEGRNVVLVDADLRRSMMQATYAPNAGGKVQGLAHYLADLCEWEDAIYQTNIEGGYIILQGKSVANPHALLTTDRLGQLIAQLERTFDTVIVDAPPIGLVVDAAEIVKACDGVILALKNNTVTKKELAEAVTQIERTGRPILGMVINQVTFDTHSAKKHYYKTYYSHYQSGYYGASQTSN